MSGYSKIQQLAETEYINCLTMCLGGFWPKHLLWRRIGQRPEAARYRYRGSGRKPCQIEIRQKRNPSLLLIVIRQDNVLGLYVPMDNLPQVRKMNCIGHLSAYKDYIFRIRQPPYKVAQVAAYNIVHIKTYRAIRVFVYAHNTRMI